MIIIVIVMIFGRGENLSLSQDLRVIIFQCPDDTNSYERNNFFLKYQRLSIKILIYMYIITWMNLLCTSFSLWYWKILKTLQNNATIRSCNFVSFNCYCENPILDPREDLTEWISFVCQSKIQVAWEQVKQVDDSSCVEEIRVDGLQSDCSIDKGDTPIWRNLTPFMESGKTFKWNLKLLGVWF
jgi:hypothetical protein